MTTEAEMPRYKCHKEVHALKINSMQLDPDGNATITPEGSDYSPFNVDHVYVRKHNPQPGGYYVVYADGYKSFSPAEVFEGGYTRIS